VKPAVLNAERAWNLADSRDMPVEVRITVATRVISIETATTTSSVVMAATGRSFPAGTARTRVVTM
jgi:hypothetical protein